MAHSFEVLRPRSFMKVLLLGASFGAIAGSSFAQTSVDEVVVTAQKRVENIQDVPIAVSAFGQDALRERGVSRIDQIATAVPNVQLQDFRGLGQPTFVIRGVALLDFNPNNTPAAGIYVDDIYQSSTVMGAGAIYDVERVEVLKGPQAGLYGRNTTGGAVQVISRKPRLGDTSGYATGNFGSYQTLHVDAGQSIPLGDTLAARVSLSYDAGGKGWQKSLADGKDWGRPDKKAVRVQLLWQPNEQFSANLKTFYAQDKSELTLATAVGRYNAVGGICTPVANGYMDNASCLTYNQLTRPGSPSPTLQSDDGKRTLSQAVNKLDNQDIGGTLTLNYDLGFATLSSITGYDHFRFDLTDDFAGAVDTLLVQKQKSNINYLSQEIRLASNPSDSKLSWTVGANFAMDRYTDSRKNDIRDNTIILRTFGLTSATGRLDLSYRQRTEYYGVFGQAEYAFNDQLKLSGALRYSDEKKEYRDGNETFPLINYYIYRNLNSEYKLDDHVTGKVSLQYTPTTEAMVYGSFSKGYKSGGFFGGFPTNLRNVDPYKEEIIYAYEMGAKTRWLDRRLTLNGSIFYYDHKDAQGFSTVPNPLVPGQYVYNLTNIGDAEHYGVELEATLRPISGLTIQANLGRLWAKVVDSDRTFTGLDGSTINYEGRPIDFSPKWSGEFVVRYEHALTDELRGGVQMDYNFRSDRTFPPTNVNKAIYALDGYGLLGGRIFVTTQDDWTVAIFGSNLAGEAYKVARLGDGLGSFQEVYGQPRRIGVELTKSW